MGCCFGKKTPLKDSGEVELESSTNSAVTCKCGLKGDSVQFRQDDVSKRYSVEGSGTALGSCALECDTAMWEVIVGNQPEGIKIGVKRYHKRKNELANFAGFLDDNANQEPEPVSWYLKYTELKEGDVVGIYWDQTDFPMLNFSVNGKMLQNYAINRIRPSSDIYPAVSVQSGSSCAFGFDGEHFKYPPSSNKFKMIVCATSLI